LFSEVVLLIYESFGNRFLDKAKKLLEKDIKKIMPKHVFKLINHAEYCFDKTEDRYNINMVNQVYGDYYVKLSGKGSNIENKKRNLKKALEYYEETDDEKTISYVCKKLGKFAENEEDYDKAKEHYSKTKSWKSKERIEKILKHKKEIEQQQIKQQQIEQEEEKIQVYYDKLSSPGMSDEEIDILFERAKNIIVDSYLNDHDKRDFAKKFANRAYWKEKYTIEQEFSELQAKYS